MTTKHVPFIDNDISEANRVMAAWLNDVNIATYEVLGDGTNPPATSLAAWTNLVANATQLACRQLLYIGKQAASIDSATLGGVLALDAILGDTVDVTGTTAITSVTLAEGQERTVRFTGVLALSNTATLVLPGAAAITTAAGDIAVFRGYAGAAVRCVSYTRKDGGAPQGAWVLLATNTPTAVATSEFLTVDGLGSAYDRYMFDITALAPATDDVALYLQIGTGVGPTWQTANYQYSGRMSGPAAGADTGSTIDGVTSAIALSRPGAGQGMGNAAGEVFSGQVLLEKPTSTGYRVISSTGGYMRSDGAAINHIVTGTYTPGGAITGVRFRMSSGNIASGTIRLYGLRK